MAETLDVLKNTDYTVEVVREVVPEKGHYYTVSLYKPSDSSYTVMEQELVGVRTIASNSTKRQLEAVVQTLMDTDTPSIVGTYVGEKEETIYAFGN